MKGRWISYSDLELAFLKARADWPRRDLHAAFCDVFGRQDVSQAAIKALCARNGWKTGRTGCFAKGQVPHNKGRPCPDGRGGRHPNALKTQFKPGQRSHTYRGPGHERIDSKDGYVILIVAERNPWTGAATRPVHKHRWLWEKAHGPAPEGHVLKCLDGDKTNTDPANWRAIPRGMLPRLAARWSGVAYDDAHPDLRPTILAAAELDYRARQLRKGKC